MKKKLIVVCIFTSILLTAFPLAAFAQSDTQNVYSDISGKWFTAAATEYGYPEIFSDGSSKFYADREITRIEFVRLLHKVLGININYFAANDIKDYFDDMKNTDVGVNELIDLITSGILERGGSFNPDKSLSREEMIHWIMNALKYKTDNNYPIPMVKPVPFSDDSAISDAYRGEIYSSVILNLVNGRGNNTLFPKDGATRGEAVKIVSNLMVLLENYRTVVNVAALAEFSGDGTLTISLTIHNNSDKTVFINHTSGQKCDFKLFDSNGDHIYTWSADKMFITLLNETEISPGEEIVFSDMLDININDALKSAVSMKAYIIGMSDDFMIDTNGYDTTIVK